MLPVVPRFNHLSLKFTDLKLQTSNKKSDELLLLVLTTTVGKVKVYHSCLDRQLVRLTVLILTSIVGIDIEERQVSFIVYGMEVTSYRIMMWF